MHPTATMPVDMWETAAPTATPVVCARHPAPPPLSVGIAPHRTLVAGSSRTLALPRTLRYVTGGGTLPLTIRTAPHARVTASLDVVVTQVVIHGTGAHRTRTTRRVVLSLTALNGSADAQGRYSPLLHVVYQPNRPVMAALTVRTRTTCGTATQRTTVTILTCRKGRRRAAPRTAPPGMRSRASTG
jgi:hypothetical protein